MQPDILRLRAYIYSLQGMYKEAVADREALIDGGSVMLRDYYLLGDNSLSLRRFSDANKWLIQVLELGKQQNETWFESAALFLLSYAKLQLGQLREAAECLDQAVKLDPECALPIHGRGIVSHQTLKDEIVRRLNTSAH